jgi:hypothetical protein
MRPIWHTAGTRSGCADAQPIKPVTRFLWESPSQGRSASPLARHAQSHCHACCRWSCRAGRSPGFRLVRWGPTKHALAPPVLAHRPHMDRCSTPTRSHRGGGRFLALVPIAVPRCIEGVMDDDDPGGLEPFAQCPRAPGISPMREQLSGRPAAPFQSCAACLLRAHAACLRWINVASALPWPGAARLPSGQQRQIRCRNQRAVPGMEPTASRSSCASSRSLSRTGSDRRGKRPR